MLEDFAGPDVWRDGIRRYIAAHEYQNTRDRLTCGRAVKRPGRAGLTTDRARTFTTQPGIPLITRRRVAMCDGGTDCHADAGPILGRPAQQVAARPLAWHVPIASDGGRRSRSRS